MTSSTDLTESVGEVVTHEVVDGVGLLTLNLPEKRNAMTKELVDQALAVHDDFVAAGVRVAVLSSRGSVFSAGGDLKEPRVPGVPPSGVRLVDTFDTSPILWVAAVQAPAYGAALQLLTRISTVVMAEEAFFALPEMLHGRYPRAIVNAVAEVIGPRRAFRMATTAERMSAAEALRLGLVEHVVPAEELAGFALDLARKLAAIDPAHQALELATEGWRTRLGTREPQS